MSVWITVLIILESSVFAGSPLTKAIYTNNVVLAEKLLDEGLSSVEEKDKLGRTPLMLACKQGKLSVVQLLINREASVIEVDSRGWSAFLYAYRYAKVSGDNRILDCLRSHVSRYYGMKEALLLDSDELFFEEVVLLDQEGQKAGRDAGVILVSDKNNPRLLTQLLSLGADPTRAFEYAAAQAPHLARFSFGRVPLIQSMESAITHNRPELVELALQKEAQNKIEFEKKIGKLKVIIAFLYQVRTAPHDVQDRIMRLNQKLDKFKVNSQKVENLERSGEVVPSLYPKFLSEDRLRRTVQRVEEELNQLLESQTKLATEGLRLAIEKNQVELAELLLLRGASPNLLEEAIEQDRREIAELCLQYGANAKASLKEAILRDREELVSLLIDWGADPTKGLKTAVEYNRKNLVLFFLSKNADATKALPIAKKFNRQELYFLLSEKVRKQSQAGSTRLDRNPSISPSDPTSKKGISHEAQASALHILASENRFLEAAALVQAGGLVDLQDALGRTPLMIATQNGSVECVRVLLDAHARIHIKDLEGHSVLSYLETPESGEEDPAETAFTIFNLIYEHGQISDPSFNGKVLTEGVQVNSCFLVKRALEKGAHPTSGLRAAAVYGRPVLARYFLDQGADATAGFMKAAEYHQDEILKVCLEQGAERDSVSDASSEYYQFPPLDFYHDAESFNCFMEFNRISMIESLLNRGLRKNAWFELSQAVEEGRDEQVKVFLSHHVRHPFKLSPAMRTAIEGNRLQMAVLLLEAGADPTSGLRDAVQFHRKQMIDLFLEWGADPKAGLDIAMGTHQPAMVRFFKERGAIAKKRHLKRQVIRTKSNFMSRMESSENAWLLSELSEVESRQGNSTD